MRPETFTTNKPSLGGLPEFKPFIDRVGSTKTNDNDKPDRPGNRSRAGGYGHRKDHKPKFAPITLKKASKSSRTNGSGSKSHSVNSCNCMNFVRISRICSQTLTVLTLICSYLCLVSQIVSRRHQQVHSLHGYKGTGSSYLLQKRIRCPY